VKVRFGLLREYIQEALFREEAWVPGRWMPGDGEPVDPDELGMDETDDRMVGDGEGPGENPDRNDFDMADHLRGDEEKTSLGSPPDETMRETAQLRREMQQYFLQEQSKDSEEPEAPDAPVDGSAGAAATGENGSGTNAAAAPTGFYTPFDMDRDHSSTWYKSPGQPAGGSGDPFRSEDPYTQLGFHPPAGPADPVASHPAVDGEEGASARLAPPIWQLSAGSDTSKVLGANAKGDSGGVDSGGESETSAPGGEVGGEDAEGDEAEGSKSGTGSSSSR